MYGKISSSWKTENGVFTYEVTVPANTSATLYIPAATDKSVKESGKAISKKTTGIQFVKFESGKAVYQLNSGTYTFTSSLVK